MRYTLTTLIIFSCFLTEAQRPIKRITVLQELSQGHHKIPKKEVVLKIRCDGSRITEYNVIVDLDVKSIAPYGLNDPYTLTNSLQAILEQVKDTNIYELEFDVGDKLIFAKEKSKDPDVQELIQETTGQYLRILNFEYDSLGSIHTIGSRNGMFRGGEGRHYFDKNGLEIKTENRHPMGFINSIEVTSYHCGLPRIRTTYSRSGLQIQKLIYTYTFF